LIAEDFYTFVESLDNMKNLLLIIVICLLPFLSFCQETFNKTDSKGMKQGKWTSRYPSGTLKYEGTFDHNKPVGQWKRYHENGKIKALMSYRPNSDKVSASLFDESGILYAKGVFEGTFRDSTWNFFKGDLVVLTENYRVGKKEGKATAFGQDGKVIAEKEWKNDLEDGICKEYYPTGIKKNEVSYTEGKRNGQAVFYDENGLKSMEGSYLDDLSDGDWILYGNDGQITFRIKYKKGEIVNKGALDSLQNNEFKQYEKAKGKIPEPKLNESGLPERP
jgi:antitoxin component YwqK of YwqJK toxin-antitoxin module